MYRPSELFFPDVSHSTLSSRCTCSTCSTFFQPGLLAHHSWSKRPLVDQQLNQGLCKPHLHQLDQSTWPVASPEEYSSSQYGEDGNLVVPTTCWSCGHRPEGGNHDGNSIFTHAEGSRCQQLGQGPDCGHHNDLLTSSCTTSEAQAQSASTAPSIDPFDDYWFCLLSPLR